MGRFAALSDADDLTYFLIVAGFWLAVGAVYLGWRFVRRARRRLDETSNKA